MQWKIGRRRFPPLLAAIAAYAFCSAATWVAAGAVFLLPLVLASLMLGLGTSAALAQQSGDPHRASHAAVAGDTSLFAVVVESLSMLGTPDPWRERVLHVNPQPLRPDSPHTFAGPDDFADVDEHVLEMRSAVLRARDLPQFTSHREPACRDQGAQMRRDGPIGLDLTGPMHVCAILAVPWPGGCSLSASDLDVGEDRGSGHWTTRVVFWGSGFFRVVDVVAERVQRGDGWRVVEQRLLVDFVV